VRAAFVVFLAISTTSGARQAFAQVPPSLSEALVRGDWVGEFAFDESTLFMRVNFTRTLAVLAGRADLPQDNASGLRLLDVELASEALFFGFAFRGDTARFAGRASVDTIEGELEIAGQPWPLRLMHRMEYDPAAVRRLAGNYRIAPDRVISMGPLDEASDWLAFFDSKTLRSSRGRRSTSIIRSRFAPTFIYSTRGTSALSPGACAASRLTKPCASMIT
jgi:hypothetical protein